MKVYLSVPIIGGRNLELAKIISNIIMECGHELLSQWVISEDPGFSLSPSYVFERDTNGVKKSDIVVAEVSTPSHGVGMEIMLAITLGKRIIALARKDSRISRMLLGAPNIEWIFYDEIKEIAQKLKEKLGS
ncbi:MAG: hypothetical protein JTT16_01935 [Candidatus Brockarchaeota archaeon]|nr:hypothetical protein [Candidatus Brockarchaeota archaeon]MBO3768069.1 hypothetical protein [Candidatus Brockarchaeota archaeon]MBO3802244.1 hypothetical protein [Candidatus Brockarchaeota archaeon]